MKEKHDLKAKRRYQNDPIRLDQNAAMIKTKRERMNLKRNRIKTVDIRKSQQALHC